MICFELIGGLGNQIFIYAFARSLAYDLNEKLYIDISRYNYKEGLAHAIYGLHPYNIKGLVGNYSLCDYTNSSSLYEGDLHYYSWGTPLTLNGCYYEGMLENIKENIELPALFTGYYSAGIDKDGKKTMTEKFFIHNEKIIREDLTYLPPVNENFKDIIDEIKNTNSVALHIRRGDYVSYFHRFGMCSLEYYRNAIQEIVSRVENPKFFIFSDDPSWVKENLEINYPHEYVIYEDNAESSNGSAELLRILSYCKHFIIANSTFSWWGAWLSDNEEKIITSPYPWYQSRELLYTDSISNKKLIYVENNYKEKFLEANQILFDFNSLRNHLKIGDETKIDYNFNEIILPNLEKSEKNSDIMLKIALKTNVTGKISIYYKTEKEEYYTEKNCINTFYYKNDEFDSYIFLPKEASLKDLRIRLSTYINPKYELTDFEIREIKNVQYVTNADEKAEIIENKPKKIFTKSHTSILNDILHRIGDNKIKKYYTSRIDIKNFGLNNFVEVNQKDSFASFVYPSWFKNDEGQGLMIHSSAGKINFTIKCVNDGKLVILLRGKEVKDEYGKRLPVYIQYTSFKINNMNITQKKFVASHDKPFKFEKKVKNGEELKIEIEWEPM